MGKGPLADRLRWAADKGFEAVSFEDRQLLGEGHSGIAPEVERIARPTQSMRTRHPEDQHDQGVTSRGQGGK